MVDNPSHYTFNLNKNPSFCTVISNEYRPKFQNLFTKHLARVPAQLFYLLMGFSWKRVCVDGVSSFSSYFSTGLYNSNSKRELKAYQNLKTIKTQCFIIYYCSSWHQPNHRKDWNQFLMILTKFNFGRHFDFPSLDGNWVLIVFKVFISKVIWWKEDKNEWLSWMILSNFWVLGTWWWEILRCNYFMRQNRIN